MLECNRAMKKRWKVFRRVVLTVIPVAVLVLLLSQTAFARNTYLINDGGKILLHTTYATDPEVVLDEAGLDLGKDDYYTTNDSRGMSEITVQRKQTITVVQDDKTTQVASYGETVDSLLRRIGIALAKADRISAGVDEQTYDGMVLTIYKAIQIEESYATSVPYETTYCYDPTIPEGMEVVLTRGVDGQLLCTDNVFYVNGEEVDRVSVSEIEIRQSVSAVVAIGTGEEVKEGAPIIGADFIITPEGETLTFSRSEVFKATAYHNTDPGCTIYTALGTLCRVGAIAVDPKVIPYGTRMYIVSNDGKYIYGEAVAEDCGGAIKGKRIDLYFDTTDECWEFGVRNCTVYFLD